MIELRCPEYTMYLPNPELGDTENNISDLQIKRAMDGTRRTFVRRNPDRLLSYTFRLHRMKAEELKQFVADNHSRKFTIVNHKDERWIVRFVSNPFDFIQPRRDEITVNLQFQGVKQ